MIFFMDGADENQKKQTELVVVDPSAKTRPYGSAAGGAGALKAVFKETQAQTGLARGAALLLKVNQPDGLIVPVVPARPPAGERGLRILRKWGESSSG